ncbi:TetR/AcrR family transcriptional regulator [Paraburkholderia silviterrae]|uniref:TetR/AcrR family transcriptional regulator n=1 Tax=Paraburkholderia silviterrae TaxID=2528715 RepID=A0A4R5M572_9BURK|nr:TetR/AcrR family transcriptional regulator [Paraburkholderia silviterrae]TDG20945.1 TetR/AcrR family transcriptional regulator [Paraburkholderia silviterrae]
MRLGGRDKMNVRTVYVPSGQTGPRGTCKEACMKETSQSAPKKERAARSTRDEAAGAASVPAPAEAAKSPSEPRPAGRLRREQQRSIDTRRAIIDAALAEFAEKGFEAASIREIAARVNLPHTTVTHHYRSKDLLWQAVAEDLFSTIRSLWERNTDRSQASGVFDRLMSEYVSFLQFTIEHPLFHQFLAREKWPGNPRLPWLAEHILTPLLAHLLPEIRDAQQAGCLPPGNPILIHYLFLALMSAPAMFGAEMEFTAGMKSSNPLMVSEYVSLVKSIFAGKYAPDAQ